MSSAGGLNQERVKELLSKAKELSDKYVVFRGEFVNSTPWWGGNYEGKALEVIHGDKAYVTAPDAKGITGKTLWFLRTVRGDGVLADFGITGSEDKVKSKVEVVVKARTVKVDLKTGKAEGSNDQVLYLYMDNFNQRLGKLPQLCRGAKGDPLVDILCTPRVLLRVRKKWNRLVLGGGGKGEPNTAQGGKDEPLKELISLLPVRPNSVSFEVEVRAKDEGGTVKDFVQALVFTLRYLGIGSGANRGFGRFKLKGYKTGLDLGEVSLAKPFTTYSRGDTFPSYKGFKGLCKKGGLSVEGALRLLGESTLKASWKIVNGRKPMSPGKDLHTWVLGLPRKASDEQSKSSDKQSEKPDVKSKASDEQPKVNCNGLAVSDTGYHFIKYIPEVREVSRRQSYVVLGADVGEDKTYTFYALKFIPDKLEGVKGCLVSQTTEKRGSQYEKSHGGGGNKKLDMVTVTDGLTLDKLVSLIDTALDNVSKYICQGAVVKNQVGGVRNYGRK
ncbi:hypothetical protein [Stygiolobus caldivivus]|uniref:Uncharacterized protein n=1 Tax=Stygiolobus caldivivus TaxID=2824673 RepID=A0A8D5U756_9CREN|nr:hypothetical protein [Stygiolobus caldivivus]BCU70044.1 hypothetical protein KN1_13410 [Stygiolobus caldivivus]